MTIDRLSLCAEAKDYLMKFCSERNQGRSGKLLWDSFLIYAHKSQSNPPAVDLYTWLQEHLDDHSGAMGTNVEALIQDYQRIVALLSAWEQVTVGSKFRSRNLERQKQELLQSMARQASTGGLTLGNHVPLEASHESNSISCSLPPNMRQKSPHILLLGRRDTGKTELMSRMVIQDIAANDRAVVAVDADGDLVDLVRNWSATQADRDELCKRIVVIDPAAGSDTGSFNPLYLQEGGDLQGTASAVVFGFKAIGQEPPGSQSQWNAQTANILRNAAMLLIANGKALPIFLFC